MLGLVGLGQMDGVDLAARPDGVGEQAVPVAARPNVGDGPALAHADCGQDFRRLARRVERAILVGPRRVGDGRRDIGLGHRRGMDGGGEREHGGAGQT